jgi:hypothetical protein
MAGKGISGTGLAALSGGSLLLWSAIKGRKWSSVLRELIAGQQPGSGTDYPITATAASGAGSGTDGGGSASGWDTAEASSFGGGMTASGKPVSNVTIASPYLPLGSTVNVQYKGKTVSGIIEDFGPADWVLVLHPERFLDLSTSMMSALTGTASNVIRVQYQVTKYNSGGRIYRPGAAKTAELKKRWTNVGNSGSGSGGSSGSSGSPSGSGKCLAKGWNNGVSPAKCGGNCVFNEQTNCWERL